MIFIFSVRESNSCARRVCSLIATKYFYSTLAFFLFIPSLELLVSKRRVTSFDKFLTSDEQYLPGNISNRARIRDLILELVWRDAAFSLPVILIFMDYTDEFHRNRFPQSDFVILLLGG